MCTHIDHSPSAFLHLHTPCPSLPLSPLLFLHLRSSPFISPSSPFSCRGPEPGKNFLPRLYKREILAHIWSFVHKPRYVDINQLDNTGRTALTVAEHFHRDRLADLLRSLDT